MIKNFEQNIQKFCFCLIYDSVIKLFLSIEGLQSLLSLLSGMYRTSLSTSVGSNTSSVQSPQTLVHYVLLNYKLFRAFIILRVCLFLRLACIHRFKLAMNITDLRKHNYCLIEL